MILSEQQQSEIIGLKLSFSEGKKKSVFVLSFFIFRVILFSQCKSEEDYYEPLYQPEASHQLLLHAEEKEKRRKDTFANEDGEKNGWKEKMERDKKVRHWVKKLLLKCETNVKRGGSVRFLNKASEKEQERENVKERNSEVEDH